MSGPDDLTAATAPAAENEQRGRPSRRSVLRTAAGAGIAAGALAATNVATSVPALAATGRGAGSHDAAAHAGTTGQHEAGEPVVAHLRDARTGEIDIFRGTSQTRLHDHALAALLLRASRER